MLIIILSALLCSTVFGSPARITELRTKISKLEKDLYESVNELVKFKDSVGLLKLAEMREVGTPYVEENKAEAFMMYSMLKDPKSIYKVGVFNFYGLTIPKDIGKDFNGFTEAANLGNVAAMNLLGSMYQYGLGVEINYDTAKDYYERAANPGSSVAMSSLGNMYRFGYLAFDYEKAKDYYEDAASLENIDATYNIGVMYKLGLGVAIDYIKAKGYFETAAILGSSRAMNELGSMYLLGIGVVADYNKAKDYYENAVKLGYSDAKSMLDKLSERAKRLVTLPEMKQKPKAEIKQVTNEPETSEIQSNRAFKRPRLDPKSGSSSAYEKKPKIE